jgi:hypothetical protein
MFLSGKPRARYYPVAIPSTCLWQNVATPYTWRVWITNPGMSAVGASCKEAYEKLADGLKAKRREWHRE